MELSLEKILRLDRSIKVLILVVTLLVITALYVVFGFLPKRSEITQLDRRLSKLLGKKAEQEAIVQNLPAFRAECRNLEAQLQTAMAQLPNKKEIPSLLQNISNLGRESGLEIPSFRPGLAAKKDFYAEVPVNLTLMGPFPQLLHFFYRIGTLPRIVNVADLSIQHTKDKGSLDNLEAVCRAVTYKFLEESEREPKDAKSGKTQGRQ